MVKSKLLIVFKDSLAGAPENLHYRIYINGIKVSEGKVDKDKDTVSYQIIWANGKLSIEGNSLAIPERLSNRVEIKVVSSGGSEKKVGEHELKRKNTTLTLISPWTRIPLAGGGKLEGDFFEVEYNVKRKDKNLFAKVIIKDIPRKIVLTALKHRGSTTWAGNTSKTSVHLTMKDKNVTFNNRTNKCNVFVHDVLTEAGIAVPWIEHGKSKYIPYYSRVSPPTAEEWADTSKLQKNWSSNKTPLPGDIGAYMLPYTDATGHVGIILTKGVCISAGWEKVEVNDVGFRLQNGTADLETDKSDFTNFRRYKHKVIKND